ncbi:NfeD family protein [Brevibacillus choshinensis]|uniref:Serine protease n=1 Tax=Brevibacillus choshinensis TaxID=54911 RepID=A0ABX7FML9_BRECH|nr:NfeD family protein [Brevibacillus choshinensis]QRG66899.1 serine protease [Brevibacillus choshinensis]
MGVLETIYIVCLACGVLYALAVLLFGHADWMSHHHAHLPVLQPILLVSGATAFGAAGYLLGRFTSLSDLVVVGLAVLIGIGLAVASYFLWVQPMSRAENSTGYTMSQLVGKLGEVCTTIPANGLGEVLVKMVSGTTFHMAASLDGEQIRQGSRVVVVEVRDHVLHVTGFPHDDAKKEEE